LFGVPLSIQILIWVILQSDSFAPLLGMAEFPGSWLTAP
jgi:hypothetical protein